MHAIAFHALPRAPRSRRTLNGVLACGTLAAGLDLGLAMLWWHPLGVAPARVLQSIAEWTIGPSAYAGGAATAVLGLLVYWALMCALAAGCRVLARRIPLLARHPLPCGALYGLAAYVAIFGFLVPASIGRPAFGPPAWAMACALAYAFLIGVPCAWFAARAEPAPSTKG